MKMEVQQKVLLIFVLNRLRAAKIRKSFSMGNYLTRFNKMIKKNICVRIGEGD